MTSIDEKRREAIQKFFDKVLCPCAQQFRERSMEFFPMQSDPHRISYYQDCIDQRIRPDQFELKAALSPAEFIAALTELWNQQGLRELAELAPKLLALMNELSPEEEPNPDLPPFTYTLF